jgi:hypothetical protein
MYFERRNLQLEKKLLIYEQKAKRRRSRDRCLEDDALNSRAQEKIEEERRRGYPGLNPGRHQFQEGNFTKLA